MQIIITPHENDVISGRGQTTNAHPGNVSYRRIVADEHRAYSLTDNKGKKSIASQIISTIQNANPPGRFLCLDKNTGLWSRMHDERVLRKVCQRLREYQKHSDTSKIHIIKKKHKIDIPQILSGISIDDLRTAIKTEERKMREVRKIEDELKKLRKIYNEKIATLNPILLANIHEVEDKKRPTQIYNSIGGNSHLRRKGADIFDYNNNDSLHVLSESERKHLDYSTSHKAWSENHGENNIQRKSEKFQDTLVTMPSLFMNNMVDIGLDQNEISMNSLDL